MGSVKYPIARVFLDVGEPMVPLVPVVVKGIPPTSYDAHNLPRGLIIDKVSGTVTGIPVDGNLVNSVEIMVYWGPTPGQFITLTVGVNEPKPKDLPAPASVSTQVSTEEVEYVSPTASYRRYFLIEQEGKNLSILVPTRWERVNVNSPLTEETSRFTSLPPPYIVGDVSRPDFSAKEPHHTPKLGGEWYDTDEIAHQVEELLQTLDRHAQKTLLSTLLKKFTTSLRPRQKMIGYSYQPRSHRRQSYWVNPMGYV